VGQSEVTGSRSDPVSVMKRKLAIGLIVFAIILFGSAGRMDWWMGWVYFGVILLFSVATTYFILQRDSEYAAERIGIRPDSKRWDVVLAALSASILPMVTALVAGLDMRFGWTGLVDFWLQLGALIVMVFGQALIFWAMAVNRFFSAVVRIQEDRGHSVVAAGPYRFVRHPGYAGLVLFTMSTPLILGSIWAYLPAAAVVVLTLVRTALEDRTLRRELNDYVEYTHRVRFRLLPGVW